MRYAINNWVYADEPLRETFSRLARFGYYGVELKGEPELYSVDEIRALSREFNLAVSSILGWCIWGIPGRDLSSPDEAERAAALRYGQACIDFAAALAAPVLIVLPFPAGRTAPVGESGYCGRLAASLQNRMGAMQSTQCVRQLYMRPGRECSWLWSRSIATRRTRSALSRMACASLPMSASRMLSSTWMLST